MIVFNGYRSQMGRFHDSVWCHPGAKPIHVVLPKGEGGGIRFCAKRYADAPLSLQLVQARVYAQASTLATLIITGILAGTATKESKPMEEEDHSWRDILGA